MFASSVRCLQDDCGISAAEKINLKMFFLIPVIMHLNVLYIITLKDIKKLLKNQQATRECRIKKATEFVYLCQHPSHIKA